MPYNGFVSSLTDGTFFQPNNPDFNLVHTFRLEVGLLLASPEITFFSGLAVHPFELSLLDDFVSEGEELGVMSTFDG